MYAAVGQIVPSGGNFTGVADVNEQGVGSPGFSDAVGITGTYTISIGGVNGYGNLTINPGTLQDVTDFGIYMVDSSININDPNNTTSGGGGALIVDLSANVLGAGSLYLRTGSSRAITLWFSGSLSWRYSPSY